MKDSYPSVRPRSFDCDETVCGEMAIFTTSSNLRVLILCLTDTDDVALLKIQVAVFAFALLLNIHLRFRGSFLRFHSTALRLHRRPEEAVRSHIKASDNCFPRSHGNEQLLPTLGLD